MLHSSFIKSPFIVHQVPVHRSSIPHSLIRNPQSPIRNLQSAIPNPQFPNPPFINHQSSIINSPFPIPPFPIVQANSHDNLSLPVTALAELELD